MVAATPVDNKRNWETELLCICRLTGSLLPSFLLPEWEFAPGGPFE
jgi:hypothetical protein